MNDPEPLFLLEDLDHQTRYGQPGLVLARMTTDGLETLSLMPGRRGRIVPAEDVAPAGSYDFPDAAVKSYLGVA